MKRILSIVLIIGLVTMGIFSNVASAKHTNEKVRIDWIISRIRTYYSSASSEQFITYLSQHIDEGLILVCLDLNNDANFTITMWGLQNVGVKWSESTVNSYYLGYFHPNNSTGSVYRCDGFFNSFYNNGTPSFQSRTGFVDQLRPDNSRLVKFPDFTSSNNKLYMGSAQSFWSTDYLCLTNCDIYASYESASVLYSRTLFGALVALYQNVVFRKNDRLYFTFSDQDVFFDVFVGSYDVQLQITFEGTYLNEGGEWENGNASYSFTESMFVRFPDVITFDGVSNIRNTGLRAVDITGMSGYSKLVSSRVYPTQYYDEGYFAENEIIISNIVTTPVDPYDELGDALERLEQMLIDLQNQPVPDSSLQHYVEFPDSPYNGASYPSMYDFYMTNSGSIGLMDDSTPSVVDFVQLDVAPRSVLVLRTAELSLTSNLSKLLNGDYISSLWSQVDVVIILHNSDYDSITNRDGLNQYPRFSPIFRSSSDSTWFLADWTDDNDDIDSGGFHCFGLFTDHYLNCVNNYILADGFTTIADGLTSLGDLNKTGFQTIASAVGSVYSAVQVTNSHWSNFLRDFGYFSNDLLAKLDLVVDKLEQIEYNTSKEEHGVWYQSLWDFFSQFVPVDADFSGSINAIDIGLNQLTPIPYVTPPLLEQGE